MKYLLGFILCFFTFNLSAQTVGQLRYDTLKILKVGGTSELKVQNRTKDSIGGIFTNVGNGWGEWLKPRTISGGIIIGLDTFYISGGGLDSTLYVKYTDTAAMLSPYLTDAYIDIDAVGDSGFSLLKKSGGRDTVIVRGGGGSGGSFDTTTIYQELGNRVKYTDTAAMLLPYLKVIDTTNKWVHGWAQFGDTTRLYKGVDSVSIVSGSSPPNFPTVDDTLTANRQLFIDTYNFRIKSQLNNLFTLNNNGLSYSGSNWSNVINSSYQEYLQGAGSTYSMFRLTTSNSRMYSQTSGVNYSFVDVAPTIITLRAKDSIQITSGIAEESLGDDMKVLVRKSNNTVIEVDPSEFGGGGGTADTIYTKFPLRVDTTGVKDSLKLEYPPNSVAVNLTNDTADVQFLPIYRVTNQTSTDTVRWIATTTIPSGTPEIYYSWSQVGKQVTVKIWAYYPTAGTAVSSAAINLPSDCPAPLVPGGWSTEAEMIVSVGSGGLFVNRTRTTNDLPNATAASVLRRNADNTGWELINKMGGGSYRYSYWNMIYEAQ